MKFLILLSETSPLADPPMRAVLLMALLAFVILGLGLVAGVLLGGRWARRLGGDDLRKPLSLRKPLGSGPREPAMLRNADWSGVEETVRIESAASDTRVEMPAPSSFGSNAASTS